MGSRVWPSEQIYAIQGSNDTPTIDVRDKCDAVVGKAFRDEDQGSCREQSTIAFTGPWVGQND